MYNLFNRVYTKNPSDYYTILSLLEGIKEIRTSIKRAVSGAVLEDIEFLK
ncbi:hypothetical protein PL321_05435 [Caloramator sp. mosi_1]|nr:hypothetical protein [Caloramator sp. mosi_1]WDC84989.1 hypothetical protein PL321_05435 [Caloramator sp. mosi_1]